MARELATQLLGQSEAIGNLFGARLAHQLAGIAALTDGDADTALAELAQANQQNPANLLRQAQAAAAVGDDAAAKQYLHRTVDFNALNNLNYSLVRRQAQASLENQ